MTQASKIELDSRHISATKYNEDVELLDKNDEDYVLITKGITKVFVRFTPRKTQKSVLTENFTLADFSVLRKNY